MKTSKTTVAGIALTGTAALLAAGQGIGRDHKLQAARFLNWATSPCKCKWSCLRMKPIACLQPCRLKVCVFFM